MRFGSVCSGIEAASVAWHPLGWEAAWFAEIEPFPSAVLAHHFPGVPNLGDMTALPGLVRSGIIEAPELLVGGTPCQDFSVAGLRAGLAGERGQLTIAFVELADAIDDARTTQGGESCIVCWENVPRGAQRQEQCVRLLPCSACRRRRAARAAREKMAGRWCCRWTPKGNRLAGPRRPIFRPGPTTPSCVPCRKCSSGVRSRRNTF